jgi:hypothetical protein
MINNTEYHPQFFTATILEWKHLLKEDVFKEIIISALQNLVRIEKVIIFGFVILNKSIDNTINTLLARSTTRAAWCYQQRLNNWKVIKQQ